MNNGLFECCFLKNLDCFEGEYVVIEIDGETRDIPRELVDETVSVSDVVILKQGKWYTDEENLQIRGVNKLNR